jgi:hypothetical protein
MPVHDWTRVEAGIVHDVHTGWTGPLRTPSRPSGATCSKAAGRGGDDTGGRDTL